MVKNVISVVDGEAGSCGKAKVVGEIATDKSIKLNASITNCMPNAGHTFVNSRGKKYVFRNIPVSIVNPNTELFIGPGSAIDMDVFKEEYERVKYLLRGRKIYVHENVPLVSSRHKEFEREHIKTGSTFKGCGAVSAHKLMRMEGLEFFSGYKNAVRISTDEWIERTQKHVNDPSGYVLLEGAQGCDLSINHSGNRPYTTSRNVSTEQMAADSGISLHHILGTIMVIRPFPIRINNITRDGRYIYTGGYGTGDELTWTQINLAAATGSYPYRGDVDDLLTHIDLEYIKYLYQNTNPIYIRGLFKDREVNLDTITTLEALELERLMYKTLGQSVYVSKILDTPINPNIFNYAVVSDLSEETTVTKMERRVFDLDIRKLKNNCRLIEPYCLYVNFIQHLDLDLRGVKGNYEDIYILKYIREYLRWLEHETGVEVAMLGTGAKNGERIKIKSLYRDIIK